MSFTFTNDESKRFSGILDRCNKNGYLILINRFSVLGCLDVIIWLREIELPWNERTMGYAAAGGHLEVVKWLRENGCPWNAWTFAYATEGGHFEVVKWLRDNGCPWNKFAISFAARKGHLEVVNWLRQWMP